ncbi:MAG: ribosome recycling factor [Candidatus Omnitrophica bacterium]|nr:ribosome recycling factor [Candidatus Omnitrophota bacterium]MCM8809593.1 ribosome recycling factor [Candidatus Omnitrophota bacterium]MCM8810818.1 ribosome recycling factor [Candidatus Omnitrophota bacterium]MCM8833040.1 ribosome recycling factor [Candidatus Omnitrophota bacterium]
MRNKIYKETEQKMKGVVEYFSKEIAKMRAGRASISLLEGILVECYGSKMPINQVATITIPQPQMIIIQPWDKSIFGNVLKAIQSNNIGLTPISDGNTIKVPIPPLSEERRKELVKILYNMGEEAKVEIRELRRKANEQLKKAKEEKQISEDDMHKGMDEIQKLTDKFIDEIDKKIKEKEKEILEV